MELVKYASKYAIGPLESSVPAHPPTSSAPTSGGLPTHPGERGPARHAVLHPLRRSIYAGSGKNPSARGCVMTAMRRLNAFMKKCADASHRYSKCASHVYAGARVPVLQPILKQVLRTLSIDIGIPSPATLFLDMFFFPPPPSPSTFSRPLGKQRSYSQWQKKKYNKMNNDGGGEGGRKKKRCNGNLRVKTKEGKRRRLFLQR